jgi:DNA polymerase-1
MKSAVFDIEADSLNPAVVHCIAVREHESGIAKLYGPSELSEGLAHLDTCDRLWGHNILDFDLTVLKRLLNWEPKETTEVIDTLIWSRFLYSDLAKNDLKAYGDDEEAEFKALIGKHSLEAWGKRLGVHKVDFQGPWEVYTQEMGDYCLADTATNMAIVRHFMGMNCTNFTALKIEHDFARICNKMTETGVCFDVEKAWAMHASLKTDLERLTTEITSDIPATVVQMKTPEYYLATWPDGTQQKFPTKGAADAARKVLKYRPKECSIAAGPNAQKIIPFNLNSRQQVRELLYQRHGWLSPALTETGEKMVGQLSGEELARDYGKLSEELLRECPFEIGQKLANYYLINKISSFLLSADEDKGWLTMCGDGRIHGRIITIGASTFRCTHNSPNVAQVPHTTVGKDKQPLFGLQGRYGADCRSLFTASPGYVMVGADLSGIEAVMLGHFLYPYDAGEFAKLIAAGDIHSRNAQAIRDFGGFAISRGDSKGCFYAYLYSAGDMKLGQVMISTTPDAATYYADKRDWFRRNPGAISSKVWSDALKARRLATAEEAALIDIGGRVRSSLEQGITGLADLGSAVQTAAKRGYLNVFDRRIPIRNTRAALNALLQGSAALINKKWVVLTDHRCREQGVVYRPLMTIHDEFTCEMLPEYVEAYSRICLESIGLSGDYYRIRVPVTGELGVGKNWLGVH